MRRLYRAFFECTHDRTSSLTLDIIIGANRHIVRKMPMCGWWGRLESDDVWPVVWTKDGQLDFGNHEGEPIDRDDRYGTINLVDRIIAVGESFDLRFNVNSFTLDLKKLTDLSEP